MSVILEDVTYIYNRGTPLEKTAIRGVSLSIGSGEFVVVSGGIGSGKSTLLQLMGGILNPTSGDVRVSANRLGVVFQFPERQFFEGTVYSDLSFPLRREGISEREIEERVRGALNAVDIDFHAYRGRVPMELSGGEKRRIAIAAVLALDPEIILMDEPLAGLDQRGKREVLQELKRLQREAGKTIVLATQEPEASRVCERFILLEGGRLVGDGKADLAEKEIGRISPIPSLVSALRTRGIDLGEGVLDAQEAFIRIRG
jgi:energy-coupling factor transport system ATP-binding protein